MPNRKSKEPQAIKRTKVQFAKHLAKCMIIDLRTGFNLNQDVYHDKILAYLGIKEKYAPLAVIKSEKGLNNFRREYIDPRANNSLNEDFVRDCIHLRANVKLENITIIDSLPNTVLGRTFNAIVNEANRLALITPWYNPWKKVPTKLIRTIDKLAHRDAIQIIPPDQYPLDRYTCSELDKVEINAVTIRSKGELQCIFSSDGIIRDLTLTNISALTKGAHPATFAGVLKYNIKNVITGSHNGVKLTPLRIGGGKCNYYVIGFSAYCGYKYEKFGVRTEGVTDLRGIPVKRYTNLVDFDMLAFKEYYLFEKNKNDGTDKFDMIDNTIQRMVRNKKCIDLGQLMNELLNK